MVAGERAKGATSGNHGAYPPAQRGPDSRAEFSGAEPLLRLDHWWPWRHASSQAAHMVAMAWKLSGSRDFVFCSDDQLLRGDVKRRIDVSRGADSDEVNVHLISQDLG